MNLIMSFQIVQTLFVFTATQEVFYSVRFSLFVLERPQMLALDSCLLLGSRDHHQFVCFSLRQQEFVLLLCKPITFRTSLSTHLYVYVIPFVLCETVWPLVGAVLGAPGLGSPAALRDMQGNGVQTFSASSLRAVWCGAAWLLFGGCNADTMV